MNITPCAFPSSSLLDRSMVESAYFQDSYRAPLSRTDARMTDIFLAIFAHHPWWIKLALIVRNRAVRLFGLKAPSTSEIMKIENKSSYAVGDKIGVWPIHALNEIEMIAGTDNKHLDFRVSILKESDGSGVVLSTVCVVHNTFGKVYLFFVVPFHKLGVRKIMSDAVAAGRL